MTDLLKYFKLLSDETRFKLVGLLSQGEICVCELAKKLEMDQSLISHHLKRLRDADLIVDRKVGRWIHCSLNKEKFAYYESEYIKRFGNGNIFEIPCSTHQKCCG